MSSSSNRLRQRQPISAVMLCIFTFLYTLPTAPIVVLLVAIALLASWSLARYDPIMKREKQPYSRFKAILIRSICLLVLFGLTYDILLIAGPQNTVVAFLERNISNIPLLHFAERYRDGAADMGEPLPNLAGLCLSLISIVSLATGVGFIALGEDSRMFRLLGPGGNSIPKNSMFRRLITIVAMFFAFNAIFATWDFAASTGSKSFLFKMEFVTGPFVWSSFLMVWSGFGILVVRDFELMYQFIKRNGN